MIRKALKKGVLTLTAAVLAAGLMLGEKPQVILGAAMESQASSNAYLKSLSVSTGTMTPEFSPEVTSYTITVGEDVEKINVTCSTADANAKVVEAGGFKGLEPGSNDAVITVQAADGTKCTYNLTIIRGEAEGTVSPEDETESEETEGDGSSEAEGEGEPQSVSTVAGDAQYIPVGGETIFAPFMVNTTFPQELIPDGFVEQDYNYKGTTVQSAYFATGDIRLLYLSADGGTSADFRIYYEDTDTFMDFLQFKGVDGKFVMPVRYQAQIKIPDNYTGSYMPWGDKVIACYIYTELTGEPIKAPEGMETGKEEETEDTEKEPVNVEDLDEDVEFYLIYAMNNEGKENFYLYDYVEGTYQRYVERDTSYELDQSYFKYKDVAHQRFVVMCFLIVLLLVAVFCIINLILRNREMKADMEDEDDGEDGEDEEETEKTVKVKRPSKKETVLTEPEKKERTAKERPVKESPEKEKTAKERPDKEKSVKEKPIKERLEKEKPVKEKAAKEKTVREKQPVEKKPVKPEKEEEFDTFSLEEKIIGQLQETEEKPKEAFVRTRKPSEFKMINLSREPEPTGLDDDFEFEFINLDDD